MKGAVQMGRERKPLSEVRNLDNLKEKIQERVDISKIVDLKEELQKRAGQVVEQTASLIKKEVPLNEVRKIKNLKEMLTQSAELFAEQTAFLVKVPENEDYQPITYKQFKNDVDALGTKLLDLGLKDKRIAVIGDSSYEWVATYMATVNGVGTIVPLDKELPIQEIENLLKTSEASAIIYADKFEKDILQIKDNLPSLGLCINMKIAFSQLIEQGTALLEKGDRTYIDAEINAEEMKILLFTSGTTGLAKGVMLSHKQICANLMDMCTMIYFDEKDTFLSVLPLHHTYECTCGFICPIYQGATVAFCEGLRHIVKNLKESEATIMLGVPLIFESIYAKVWKSAQKSGMASKMKVGIKTNNVLKVVGMDFSKKIFSKIHDTLGGHMRLLISGAAGIDPIVSKGYRDLGILLIQGYGLTECSPIVTVNRVEDYKDAAAGLPLPSVEVMIDNPNDEGIGEIICKGPNVMMGYFENEEATQEVLRDGWFYTGDLGYRDIEGFIYITGRKKNVIVTKNGKNIFPEEVESYLNRSQYVAETLVWGKFDIASGETHVNAKIVPDYENIEEEFGNEYTDEKIRELIQQEVKAVNRKMQLYKRIKEFTIQKEEFAKTTTKKIKRFIEKTG